MHLKLHYINLICNVKCKKAFNAKWIKPNLRIQLLLNPIYTNRTNKIWCRHKPLINVLAFVWFWSTWCAHVSTNVLRFRFQQSGIKLVSYIDYTCSFWHTATPLALKGQGYFLIGSGSRWVTWWDHSGLSLRCWLTRAQENHKDGAWNSKPVCFLK